MQAVILAGGQGTRLRPLTSTTPKPLLPVANVPIIRRIIDRMPADVDEVLVAVNYKLELLAGYFRDHDVGRNVTLVEEREPLGTAGAIKNLEDHIDGPFFVFNGDVIDALDLDSMRRFHRAKGGLGTISLMHVGDPTHFGIMQMDGDRILRFVEKPRVEDAPSDLANAGTYILEPEALDLIKPATPTSIERETFPALLAQGEAIYGFPFEGFWIDCGRPETFLRANEAVLRAAGRMTLLGEGTVNHGARFDDWAVVGRDCHLGARVSVSRSVLLDRVLVGSDVTIKDSVVAEDARIGEGAALVDCVVGPGARVDDGVLLRGVKVE
jgi:NDP-sugar pyrophosphorylase family protein